ncbi:MAG: PhoPQ-activated pathogenicity-related family protein [Pirellulales bacterium]|nr:PhoPQ-activated pathogenicity-related family protein [Pirellulales bacterium]
MGNVTDATLTAADLPPAATEETALDRYLAQPDPVYGWKVARTVEQADHTLYVLELTSQTWRTEKDVDRPVWKHWLSIVVPKELKYPHTAFLYIGGGENGDPAPEKVPERVTELARGTGTVVAELGMVPNQPLRFTDSPDEAREEDNIIGYTRVKYMQTRDETWLVRLAMVKSGIRAMDAMQEFLATDAGGKLDIQSFVVAGASKRGWTTWLVGATDPRVVAIVPLVIDALNSEEITRHHYRAYGFFSPALDDYVRHGLFPGKIGTPEYREILNIEDPYEYRARERLQIPKFIVNAAGDEFFLPDNAQFYYPALSEEKHLRYVPNAKHSLAGSDARESIEAFYQSILDDQPRPHFRWRHQGAGTVVVTPVEKPSKVTLWQATNPQARDFRLDELGKAYQPTVLEPAADGAYEARVPATPQGYTAYFVELEFPSGGRYPFKFTTDVRVVPDVLPFEFPQSGQSQ